MNGLSKAIWDRIEDRIDAAPSDGVNWEGDYSSHLRDSQRSYIEGMRSGRLAALAAVKAFLKTQE